MHIKVYSHFNNIGWSHVKIILINEYYLDNKDQLLREEDNYIQMNKNDKCCLNSSRAFLSEEEKKEYDKQYYDENKEQIKEYHKKYDKKYREENKEQLKEYHKKYVKKYREENKEQIKEQNKKYREENRQNINEKKKTKITCGCGSVFRNDDKSKHEKSNKHKAWLPDSIQNAETI